MNKKLSYRDLSFFFVGSLPYLEIEPSIQFVQQFSPHLPFLPQLPRLNPQEDMIGQVIRGLDIGEWDERASSALPKFFATFARSPKVKFQIAGPFTSARALSVPIDEMFSLHKKLVSSLVQQFRREGIEGEIWVQLDEPFWSKQKNLPTGYTKYLLEVRVGGGPKMKLGLHSCATDRPHLSDEIRKGIDFFHFDFKQVSPSEREKEWMASGGIWALGVFDHDFTEMPFHVPKGEFFLSTPCGLAEWQAGDVETLLALLPKDSVQ